MIARLMGLPTISPRDLDRLVRDRAVHVYDVNAPASWLGARVPGAVHLDPLAFERRDLPDDPAAPIVFYCSGPLCRKAPNAAQRAKKLGFTDVRVLSAGITGWTDAGMAVESGPVAAS